MSNSSTDFQSAAKQERASLVWELLTFLGHNKKWWLLPILVCLGLLAFLALFAGSGAGPFLYTMF